MAIETSPEWPVPGDEITLSIDPVLGDATATRFELTSVSDESALETGMLVDAAGAYIQTFTPDVPGEYGIRSYDVQAFVGLAGFDADTAAGVREVFCATATTTVYVGSAMLLRMRTIPGHDATLRLVVHDSTVRAASIVDPATDLARAAILDSAVATAVTTTEGIAVSALAPTLTTRVAALGAAYQGHIANTTAHDPDGDTVNGIIRDVPYSDEAALLTLAEIYEKLLAHLPSGVDNWHNADDTLHQPITPKPLTKEDATVCASDIEERVYELHRVTVAGPPDVHDVADTTNVLAAPPPLTSAIVAYLNYIASNDPSGPTGENEGAVDAEGRFGMSVG
jgi:hypothetical protein